jgi:SAM-dependent methyltransferase
MSDPVRKAGTGQAVPSWRDFWNGTHRIYVNDRHREVHYAKVAADIAQLVAELGGGRVVDFGCGEALHAPQAAARCDRLWLVDAAPTVVQRLEQRFAGDPRIAVLAADNFAALPDGGLVLVIVNSVAQNVSADELLEWLRRFGRKLRPGGAVVLADILPPQDSAITDAVALLRLAARHGFLRDALVGLAATFLSDYRRLRREVGLTRYDEQAMLTLLGSAGFDARRRPSNLGFNQRRMTYVGRSHQAPADADPQGSVSKARSG